MPKIFISYRHVEPDQNLAQFLVDCFQRNGLEVFIDRQMEVGVRWVEEIERELRSSDCFVVLLSKESIARSILLKDAWADILYLHMLALISIATMLVGASAWRSRKQLG